MNPEDVEAQIEAAERRIGHLFVIASVLVFFLAVALAGVVSTWVRLRLQGDFWPPDRSYVGPNLVASVVQGALVLLVMAVFYPPMRKAFNRSLMRHKDELKAHFTQEMTLIHAKVDHLITHSPDIPDFPGGTDG